jgi:acyl dehydratase
MAARQIAFADIPSLVGEELGVSDWYEVTQEEVNAFADATHDHQWIHVDPERAAKESPFGGPIAHGYYTLSLAPYLISQIWTVDGATFGVNYGLNKLRFPAPVPIGRKLRLKALLTAVNEVSGGLQMTVALTFEVEGASKPSCVAEALYRYYGA